jgi:hypothetical protein
MESNHAQAIAERLHADDLEPDGTPLLMHIERVARRTPPEAHAVAWLHEALETDVVTEQELLDQGVSADELRALRLLVWPSRSRSSRVYLAHLELVARAAGRSGRLARMVKIADLDDRRLHPRVRRDGWTPPYARGLELLLHAAEQHDVIAADVG